MNKETKIGDLREKLKEIIGKHALTKLNMGCGWGNFPKDWLNVGLFLETRIKYGEIKELEGAQVIHYDLNDILPIEEGSMVYVYGAHFIEHLSFEKGPDLLKWVYKVMKNNGVIRLACPDLELWIKKYTNNDLKFFDRFYEISPSFPNLKTKGEIFVGQMYGWGHKWLYDYESLKDLLERAGFTNVKRLSYHISKIPDIKVIEPENETRLMETLYVEAIKRS